MNILLAESFDPLRGMVKNMLKGLGVDSVTEAHNGLHARELLGQQAFDCVVAACWLPGMNGLALLRHIRTDAHLHRLPVLMMTDKAHNKPCTHCVIRAGACGCIVKPFTAKMLKEKVDGVLALG